MFVAMAVLATLALATSASWAGNPHFVSCSATSSGNTLTVNGKEAGLGDEDQVTILVTATALCINNGGKHPKAVNKASVSDVSNQPVQNGQANFTINVTATFQPDCSPPMTVELASIMASATSLNEPPENSATRHH
jgi:hypothetical protein